MVRDFKLPILQRNTHSERDEVNSHCGALKDSKGSYVIDFDTLLIYSVVFWAMTPLILKEVIDFSEKPAALILSLPLLPVITETGGFS